jgi:hypothetical protein
MSHHTATYTTIFFLALVTVGCASSHETTGDSAAAGNITVCTDPRPQICTREYRPVCAILSDGSTKTYATGCTACSDPKVSGYRDLACE